MFDNNTEIIHVGGGIVNINDCNNEIKYKSYVIPYIVEDDIIKILTGVRRIIPKFTNNKSNNALYMINFFGGTAHHKPHNDSDWKKIALRELCEESISTINLKESDLIHLGNYKFNDSDFYQGSQNDLRCTEFAFFATKFNNINSKKLINQINQYSNRKNIKNVGMPCFENDFVDFFTLQEIDNLIKDPNDQYNYKMDLENDPFPWSQEFGKDWLQRYLIYQNEKNKNIIKLGISQKFAELFKRTMEKYPFLIDSLKQHTGINFDFQKSIQNKICDCQKAHQYEKTQEYKNKCTKSFNNPNITKKTTIRNNPTQTRSTSSTSSRFSNKRFGSFQTKSKWNKK